MPRHQIWMSFPDKPLRNVDTTIAIWSNGKKLGQLHISRGTLDWQRGHRKKAKHITWERLAALLDEE